MINRRQFHLLAGASSLSIFANAAGTSFGQTPPKKKVAFLGTWVKQHSHAQHFLDRLTLGKVWEGAWQSPRVDVASVFIDQFPDEGDLGKQRIARHQLKQYNTVREALTLGGDKLAVDGVVIIGEHGNYPKNKKGQVLYPRYKWFKEAVRVFEESGRAVPIFNDKHLSTDWKECKEMVADARRLKFPFHAGSSLPVTWRMPSIDMPYGADLKESVCVAYGGVDSYDFHALETAQCMSERRRGGEVGIRSVHALKDENLWRHFSQDRYERTRKLFVAALCRSHNLPVEGGYPTDAVTFEWARKVFKSITGYFIEHLDGFHTAVFMTQIRDFNYAGAIGNEGDILSCQMYLPMPNHGSTTADFFNPLTHHMESMFLTGKEPYPAERTLLTSGMVIGGVDSLHAGQQRVEYSDMNIAYRVPNDSYYWRS